MAEVERGQPEPYHTPPDVSEAPNTPAIPEAPPKNVIELFWGVTGDGERTRNSIEIIRSFSRPVCIVAACAAIVAVLVVNAGRRGLPADELLPVGTVAGALVAGLWVWVKNLFKRRGGGEEAEGTQTRKNSQERSRRPGRRR